MFGLKFRQHSNFKYHCGEGLKTRINPFMWFVYVEGSCKSIDSNSGRHSMIS